MYRHSPLASACWMILSGLALPLSNEGRAQSDQRAGACTATAQAAQDTCQEDADAQYSNAIAVCVNESGDSAACVSSRHWSPTSLNASTTRLG